MAMCVPISPYVRRCTEGMSLEFQLVCTGCPSSPQSPKNAPWICDHCYYKHPDPVDDPFYQSTVKSLMYFCAAILLFVRVIIIYIPCKSPTPDSSLIWLDYGSLCVPMRVKSGKTLNNSYILQSFRYIECHCTTSLQTS
jgi:hypothetical protein